jgi:hypothetical protein
MKDEREICTRNRFELLDKDFGDKDFGDKDFGDKDFGDKGFR